MNINKFKEIRPGHKYFKRLYVAVMLWFMGRAIQAAGRTDREVKEEFDKLPGNFSFTLGIYPDGPYMIVGKNEKGKAKYLGWNPEGKRIPLKMYVKNLEAAMLVFTFRESTSVAFAHGRFLVDGNLTHALGIVKVLGIVEVYLLPKIIAKLAVKRYPKWSDMNPFRKHMVRIFIYMRTILGI